MTKRELINTLEALPVSDETQMIIQKDAEGNDYSPLVGAEVAIYVASKTWCGEVYNPSWTAEYASMDEEEWDDLKNNKDKRCVVLWPIN